jgi:hypothetical protein
MTDISEIERLRYLTNFQAGLVLNETSLAEEAIRHGEDQEYEDQDDPKAFHVSRGRPTALIIPFPKGRLNLGAP